MWCYLFLASAIVASAYANVNADDMQYFMTNDRVRFFQIRSGQLDNLGVNQNYEVKVLSHGWIDNVDSSWYEPTKDNYLRRGGATIIAIDWSRHAGGLYSTAISRLEAVANHVADKLMEFSSVTGIPLTRFHLIGHSLGAHLFGFVGQRILAVRGELVGRITGLDPAGPAFENRDPSRRLSPDDAWFVDNIHTDNLAGIARSIGHIDYYPNGGSRQNGCIIIGCSHNRAPLFFFESVVSNGFITVQCNSRSDFNNGRCNNNARTVMGENVNQSLRGDFHLNTNSRTPFAMYTL
nr:endothelial lipase-like [Onthophagus taurus]